MVEKEVKNGAAGIIITIVCPHCSFSKEISAQTLPPEGTWVTCPKCSRKFVTSQHTVLRRQEKTQPVATPVVKVTSDFYARSQREKIEQEYQKDKSYLQELKMNTANNDKDVLYSKNSSSALALKSRSDVKLLIYLVALILLSLAQIDDDNPVMYFANTIAALIPSISATASISPNQNCAKLILSICWVTVIPLYLVSVKNIRNMTPQGWNFICERVCKYVGTKNVMLTYIIALLCTLPLLYLLYFINPLGGYSWRRFFLYKLAHSSNVFMPFWGICITCGVWAMLVFISIMTYGIAIKGSNKF